MVAVGLCLVVYRLGVVVVELRAVVGEFTGTFVVLGDVQLPYKG